MQLDQVVLLGGDACDKSRHFVSNSILSGYYQDFYDEHKFDSTILMLWK